VSAGASANGGGSDDLVARTIRELIQSVPGEDEAGAGTEAPVTSQPWAETASPSSKSKRPLEAILAEYEERVRAAPEARAELPADPHPSVTFYARFGRQPPPGDRRRRRTSGRKRRGGGRGRSG
jgi:hypothetical protein